MDIHYAKAYMAERLQAAENRRLVDSIRRHPNGPSVLTRLEERWFGRLRQTIGTAPAVAGTPVAVEADCCAA